MFVTDFVWLAAWGSGHTGGGRDDTRGHQETDDRRRVAEGL